MTVFFVGLFGLVGIYSRWYLGVVISRTLMSSFPFATFSINALGSFLLAVFYVVGVERFQISEELRVGIMVGLLGGFTTFSTFSLETIRLFEQSNHLLALLYLSLSPLVCFGAAFGGFHLTRYLIS